MILIFNVLKFIKLINKKIDQKMTDYLLYVFISI